MQASTTFTFTDSGGFEFFVRRWEPNGDARGVLQVAHGAVGHDGRYAWLAGFLNDAGIAVYAPDHRGHGETGGNIDQAGQAGDGWNGIVADFGQLAGIAEEHHPDTPIFVLGHSIGW